MDHDFGITKLKAKKEYQCIWCGYAVEKGEVHVKHTILWEGDLSSNRYHTECNEACNQMVRESGDQYMELDECSYARGEPRYRTKEEDEDFQAYIQPRIEAQRARKAKQ